MVVPPLSTADPATVAAEKQALRAAMRAARAAFAPVPIAPPPAFLARLEAPAGAAPRVIAAYLPLPGEADPALLVAAAAARGWRLALPRITARAAPMRFLDGAAPRAAGPLGLTQPVAEAPELAPAIILTPLLAFDRALRRLGQGAGYYDRAFADHPDALRIGVAWSIQQAAAVPCDGWDVPLHAVITEKDWIEP